MMTAGWGIPGMAWSMIEGQSVGVGSVQVPPAEVELGKIVARYADGKILKGYSRDFYPNKPHFHLFAAGAGPSEEPTEVRIKDLKAVFFVRDFGGDPSYHERKQFAEGDRLPGRRVEVKFKDGEVLVGTTLGYDSRRPGFFFTPVDPKSNNLKVLAVAAAVTNVSFL